MPAIDQLFDMLLNRKGSDLHLTVGYPPMARIHGTLQRLDGPDLTPASMDKLLFEILTPFQAERFKNDRDLDFAYTYGTKARFRANYLAKTTGNGAVFRTIPTKILTAEQLGVPEAILTQICDRGSGLCLVTGPTGSGKSTTLAAMLDYINKNRAGHILTIEDPVEFVHQPHKCQVTHKEVGEDVATFTDAIRSAVREDADVVLVGELRGAETMKLALQMANAGVQVFATVHTNSAGGTIDRFINVFGPEEQAQIRGMLAESLAGIVSQQLLRLATGKGRVAAHEILIGVPAVSAIIREGKTSMIPSLIQAHRAQSMQTMDAALEQLVTEGKVTAADALDKASDKEAFERIPVVARGLAQAEAGGA